MDIALSLRFIADLVKAGASERSANIFVELRGIGGEPPRSLRGICRDLSAERIRQIVLELETGVLRTFIDSTAADALRNELQEALILINQFAPGSDESIRDSLIKSGVNFKSPASAIRLADVIGCDHGLRLTEWTSRSKYQTDTPGMLAAPKNEPGRITVTAIVPTEMPEIFESFINFSRKFSRGAGVIAAGVLADRYSQDRGVAITQPEAVAFLTPFAVHLGRHNGDDWFAFFNSANDLLRKTSTRVDLFGHYSFELLSDFHKRYNRSLYANDETQIPESVLRCAIELAGYLIDGDIISRNSEKQVMAGAGRGASDTQTLMVKIFKETLLSSGIGKSVARTDLVTAMKAAGIRESTAHIYLGNQGLFLCQKGRCRLADEIDNDVFVKRKSTTVMPLTPISVGAASYPIC